MFGREDDIYRGLFDQFRQALNLVTSEQFLAAAADGNDEVVDEYIRQNGGYILQQKCERMNVTDEHGNTALILAVKNQHVDTVKLLLKSNIDVNAFDGFNYSTALHAAISNSDVTMLNTLLADDRIELGCLNRRGESPLRQAIRLEFVKNVKLLLEAGAPIVGFEDYISYLDARITKLEQETGPDKWFSLHLADICKEIKDLLNLHHARSAFCNEFTNLHVKLSKSEIRKIHSMSPEDFAALPFVIHDSFSQALRKFDVETLTTVSSNKTEVESRKVESRNKMRM